MKCLVCARSCYKITNQHQSQFTPKNCSQVYKLIDLCLNSYLDELLIQEDLLDILPMIEEANAISEELDKKVILKDNDIKKLLLLIYKKTFQIDRRIFHVFILHYVLPTQITLSITFNIKYRTVMLHGYTKPKTRKLQRVF